MPGGSSEADQGVDFTSPVVSGAASLLNIMPVQAGLGYVVPGNTLAPGNTLKDGNRYILKIADLDSLIGSWLAPYVNRLITVYLPQYNVAWTGYLSIRRKEHPYLYIRYPRQLRRFAEELWRIGTIPVVVIIPTIHMTPTQGSLRGGIKPMQG
jgi:hypothetical protein